MRAMAVLVCRLDPGSAGHRSQRSDERLHLFLIGFPKERVTILVLRFYRLDLCEGLEIELAKTVFGDE